jgi:two-component system, NarL family, invasion response regulator UvrY
MDQPFFVHPVSLILADDAADVREALIRLINGDRRLLLLGAAGDVEEVVELAAALKPDLAVVDVRMPGGGGYESCRRILEQSPRTRVVALSAFGSPSMRRRMAEAGAVDYLTKGGAASELLNRLVEAGRA